MQSPKITVMGVGNILMSDEGLGVRFLEELAKHPLPENVELIEGGTAGMELVYLVQETDYLILIDAVNAKAEPGSLFRFQPEDLKIFPEQYEVSFHQVGIIEVLAMAGILGTVPQTLIFGVQPKVVEWGIGISPEIEVLFPKLADRVLQEITSIQREGTFTPFPSPS